MLEAKSTFFDTVKVAYILNVLLAEVHFPQLH